MQNFNWSGIFQLLIYALLLGTPAIGWLIKKLREQAAIKADRERRRQMERDALRTTQVVDRTTAEEPTAGAAAPDDRQRAMRELAMQRQAQLQELRQRQLEAARLRSQQQGQQQGQQQVRATPLAPQPAGGTSLVGGPSRAPAMVPAPAPVRTPVQAPSQRRRPSPSALSPSRQSEAPERAARTPRVAEPRAEGEGKKRPRLDVRSLLFDETGHVRTRDELRGLIAVTEVLGKPVSMRNGFGLEGER